METKRGSLGQYRKWAGVDPEHVSSVNPINGQSTINDFQPSPQRRSSNDQMKTLQMRMTEARQQSVYAHQRVADQIIQGDSQFKVFRKGESDFINKNAGFGSRREPSPRVYPWVQVSKTVDDKIIDGGNPNEAVRPLKGAASLAMNRNKYNNIEMTPLHDISDDNLSETIPNHEIEKRNVISNKSLESKAPAPKKVKERNIIGDRNLEILSEAPTIINERNVISDRSLESTSPAPEKIKIHMKDPAPEVKKNRTKRSSVVREIITPAPVKPNPHIEELSALTVDIIKLIDSNVSALGETNEKRKAVEFEKLEEVVEERRRQLREFLAYKYQGAALKLPMWKHRLGGNLDPPPESVLKGKSLFQVKDGS